MSATSAPPRPGGRDYLLLGVVCLLLFGVALVDGRPLTGHESVLPQNAREMMVNHSWLVPTCGGFPWLERPPMPDWVLVGLGTLFGRGDRDWVMRLGPALMAYVVVCLVTWIAGRWYGRAVGLLSGLILATMNEFYTFATDPEGDMFLCAAVNGAVALFVAVEWPRRPAAADDHPTFFGRRPGAVWAFFVLLGLTNLAKGPLFGTLMVAVPVGGFLLANGSLRQLRRYVWCWGWLAFAVLALAWPVAVYARYPDILEMWGTLFGDRLNESPFREPAWYYAVQLPYLTLPWSVAACLGLWLTAGSAYRERSSPERFLWCWAVLTPLVFSIPQGKHHHYLLQCLAPWAVLAAVGSVRLWQSVPAWPAWVRQPLLAAALVGASGDAALLWFRASVPGPGWLVPVLAVGWPAGVFAACWLLRQRNGRVAVAGAVALLIALYGCVYDYRTRYFNGYKDDLALLEQARALRKPGEPLYLSFDTLYPLETFHLLFYSGDDVVLLHNLSFLLDEHIRNREVYVLGRYGDRWALANYGSVRVVLQSAHTRSEASEDQKRTLFRVRLRDDLPRVPADVECTAMQGLHQAPGPFLHGLSSVRRP